MAQVVLVGRVVVAVANGGGGLKALRYGVCSRDDGCREWFWLGEGLLRAASEGGGLKALRYGGFL
jgi:hypothetical protein